MPVCSQPSLQSLSVQDFPARLQIALHLPIWLLQPLLQLCYQRFAINICRHVNADVQSAACICSVHYSDSHGASMT